MARGNKNNYRVHDEGTFCNVWRLWGVQGSNEFRTGENTTTITRVKRQQQQRQQQPHWQNVFRPLTCKLKMLHAFKLALGSRRGRKMAGGRWQVAGGSLAARLRNRAT